jgi:deoxyribodipyrimidine photo-lyase
MGDLSTAIWWIRRDLRLSDNQALSHALSISDVVIPVFILDPKLLNSPNMGQNRLRFLLDGLRALEADLRTRGSALVLRQGEPLNELSALMEETGAAQITAQADVSPYARRRDELVKQKLPLTLVPGITVHPAETLLKADGSPYTVFTPFSHRWADLRFPGKPIPVPVSLRGFRSPASLQIPEVQPHSSPLPFQAGEAAAQAHLARFITSGIFQYAQDRDRMDLDGTSQLSPYLRFGMLSARQVAWAAREAAASAKDSLGQQGAETWLKELVWREFYSYILHHFPYVLSGSFRAGMRAIRWQDDPAGFSAWAEGRTGYPVVDAGMRQLNSTGWMHNRARMIAASFLVKDLLINWQLGERYFMQHLLDADPASNNGGWQWTAGTGTDAAPYFRVFNPVLQGKKYDPKGVYVRRWVVELSHVPDQYIHTPWEMPVDVQTRVGCVVGKDYPAPIVDHNVARLLVRQAYRR